MPRVSTRTAITVAPSVPNDPENNTRWLISGSAAGNKLSYPRRFPMVSRRGLIFIFAVARTLRLFLRRPPFALLHCRMNLAKLSVESTANLFVFAFAVGDAADIRRVMSQLSSNAGEKTSL
jgi:hypothetical protein